MDKIWAERRESRLPAAYGLKNGPVIHRVLVVFRVKLLGASLVVYL